MKSVKVIIVGVVTVALLVVVVMVVISSLDSADENSGRPTVRKQHDSNEVVTTEPLDECSNNICSASEQEEDNCSKDCFAEVIESEYEVSVTRDIIFTTVGDTKLSLDLYMPEDFSGTPPLVLWIHGGGFSSGDKGDVAGVARETAAFGFAVAAVNYRLSGEAEYPAGVDDLKTAVEWLRNQADEYGYDGGKIASIGGSAGGYMSAMLAVDSEGVNQIQAAVDLFGPTDFVTLDEQCEDWCVSNKGGVASAESKFVGCAISKADCAENALEASPVSHVDGDEPPVLIIHGDQDVTIPIEQSYEFFSVLSNAEVGTKMIVAPGFAHDRNGIFHEYQSAIIQFLDYNLNL